MKPKPLAVRSHIKRKKIPESFKATPPPPKKKNTDQKRGSPPSRGEGGVGAKEGTVIPISLVFKLIGLSALHLVYIKKKGVNNKESYKMNVSRVCTHILYKQKGEAGKATRL